MSISKTSLTTTTAAREKQDESKETKLSCKALIPGLPNDIASLCLLHLPYPYQALVRPVSSSWNNLIQDPSFLLSKKSLSLSLPYLFVFSFHKTTLKSQWQALDLRSNTWFVLPPMPCSSSSSSSTNPPAFAFTSLPRQGMLFVLGGMRAKTHLNSDCNSDSNSLVMNSVMMYQTCTNKWSTLSPMKNPRAFFTACAAVASPNGNVKIIAAGGCGSDPSTAMADVECYDVKTDTWHPGAEMRSRLLKYDSAVVGNRVFITEGWSWPFMFMPRGVVYDPEEDSWSEMSAGMREGWTGMGVVVGEKNRERLMVISEHGDHRLKVYVEDGDRWEYVGGERFPCEVLKKPFAACGDEDGRRIYVVGSGLHVGIGRLFDGERKGELWVEWDVIAPPKAFQDFSPCNSQLLYA